MTGNGFPATGHLGAAAATHFIESFSGGENPNIGMMIKTPIAFASQPSYAANFADDRVLMGASHDVFVGKVIAQTGTKKRGASPETQFSVEVISNIKGNLRGTVTVDQFGGYENGALYTVDGGPIGLTRDKNDTYLLQPGSTYLLAARYNDTENWYTLNSFATARKLLSQDASLNDGQLKALAASDGRVQVLQSTYQDEVPFSADISHAMAYNTYSSRHFDVSGQAIDDTVALAQSHQQGNAPVDQPTAPANSPVNDNSASANNPDAESVSPAAATDQSTAPDVSVSATPNGSPTPTPTDSPTSTPTNELIAPQTQTTSDTPSPTSSPSDSTVPAAS
jgi:hypothetical protein